jgi:putative transposase
VGSSRIGLSTVGHSGSFGLEPINALGELTSTLIGVILLEQVDLLNKESRVTPLGD